MLTTSAETVIGVSGGDDVITGTDAAIDDGDLIVDASTTDSDTLVINGRAFQAAFDTDADTIINIETIDVNYDTLTNATFDAEGVITAATLDFSNSRDGSGASLTVSNVTGGSTITATDFNAVAATADAAGDLTMTLATATGNITGTVSTTGDLVITANASTGTIDANSATGASTVTANSATVIDADATGAGDITINTTADATITADSAGGDIVIVAAAAADVAAVTSGTGTITVTAEGDTAIATTAKTATVTLSGADSTADATIDATGVGTADSLTVNAGEDFTVDNQAGNEVETITVTASSAVTATITTTAADTYVGDSSNVTFSGDSAMFTTATVTAAAVTLTDVTAAVDATDFTVSSIEVTDDDMAAGRTITLGSTDSTVVISGELDRDLTLAVSDGTTTAVSWNVNITLSEDINNATGAELTLTGATGADAISTATITISKAQTDLLLDAGDTAVTLLGSKAVVLDVSATAIDVASLDASDYTGRITATVAGISATFGSAVDTITASGTSTDLAIDAGAGNDVINTAAAIAGSIDGGDGTDTLNITGAVDLSAATLSNIEFIDVNGNTVAFDGEYFDGLAVVIDGAGIVDFKNITSTLDLSNLSFASTATTTIDFVTDKDLTLGASSAVAITGSSSDDTIDTDGGADTILAGAGDDNVDAGAGADVVYGGAGDDTLDGEAGNDTIYGEAGDDTILGDAGNDTIDGGEGADTITGGAGNDTISLAETTAAIDTVVLAATGKDTISGFDSGSDIIDLTTVDANFDVGDDTTTDISTAGAANSVAWDDNQILRIETDGTAADITTGGTATITDFTNLTQVAAYVEELVDFNDTAATSEDGVLILVNGTTSYVYHVQDGAADNTTLNAGDLTLIGVVTGEAVELTDLA